MAENAENTQKKAKKSFFESPLMRTAIKSANAKIFPEGGLGYFIGPTLALIANSVLSSYLNAYMLNVLNMNAWASWFISWLPVVSVVFVVLGNILIGRLMDKSKTKAGKARPLLLIAIPISILALLMLFVFSPFTTEASDKSQQILALVLLAVGYNLWFALAYPFYYTPHAALVNLSTRNSKDRSLLATISNATALAAMGLCSMILPFFLVFLFRYQMTDLPAGAVPVYDQNVADKILYYTMGEGGAIIYDQPASYNAWKIFVIALMVATAVGIIIEYYFTRERVTEESFNNQTEDNEVKKVPIKQQIKACFKDKFWWIMIAFFLLYQFGGMIKNVSQLYYCQAMFPDAQGNYSVATGGQFQGTLSIIGAIPTALGMVIAWPLANKIGKGRAILFGSILAVIGGAIGGYVCPDNFYVLVTSFVIKALGSTPAMYLSLALLADTLDHQEAMHGFRTDGFTMTIYGAIMAGMTGIATGVLNIVLNSTGYSATNISSPAIRAAMPWVFTGGETLCYLVILIIFIFMGVEKFGKFDQKAIVVDQRAKALAEGKEYVDPKTALAMQEEESNAQSEAARIEALKAKCEKKGLNFEEEEAKYQRAKADKKAAADAKKAAKEKAKQEKFDAMTDEQKAAAEAKKAAAAEKQAKRDAEIIVEFNKLRTAHNRTEITLDDDTPPEETVPVTPDGESTETVISENVETETKTDAEE